LTKWFPLVAALIGTMMLTAACASTPAPTAGADKDYGEVKLGYQFGTSYLPVEVIAEHQLLEKRLKVKVTKQQLGGGAALTEAMIAGATDIGFMGLGPFFVGWAKGIDWKIAASMQDMPIGLNAIKPGAKSLQDIGPTDKIAVPGINSIQHVMLAMEAQKQLGDARALDKNLVVMAHPDGERALMARSEVTFHYTAPPFLERERKQPGVTAIVDSYVTMGQSHTFNVAVVTAKFKNERPEVYKAFAEAMEEAVAWIRENPDKAADLMIKLGDTTPKEQLIAQITDKSVVWTTEPHGLQKFAAFMKEAKFIEKLPKDWLAVTWENLHGKQGN
jgi:NitT/TauT family transport system substrate-binding protein